jgi:hypothetical protein
VVSNDRRVAVPNSPPSTRQAPLSHVTALQDPRGCSGHSRGAGPGIPRPASGVAVCRAFKPHQSRRTHVPLACRHCPGSLGARAPRLERSSPACDLRAAHLTGLAALELAGAWTLLGAARPGPLDPLFDVQQSGDHLRRFPVLSPPGRAGRRAGFLLLPSLCTPGLSSGLLHCRALRGRRALPLGRTGKGVSGQL